MASLVPTTPSADRGFGLGQEPGRIGRLSGRRDQRLQPELVAVGEPRRFIAFRPAPAGRARGSRHRRTRRRRGRAHATRTQDRDVAVHAVGKACAQCRRPGVPDPSRS